LITGGGRQGMHFRPRHPSAAAQELAARTNVPIVLSRVRGQSWIWWHYLDCFSMKQSSPRGVCGHLLGFPSSPYGPSSAPLATKGDTSCLFLNQEGGCWHQVWVTDLE
jgi:hypothetical protein